MSKFRGIISPMYEGGAISMGDCGLTNTFHYLPIGKVCTLSKNPIPTENVVLKEFPQYSIEQYSVPVEDWFLNLRLAHHDIKKGGFIHYNSMESITNKIVIETKYEHQNLVFCGSVQYMNNLYIYGMFGVGGLSRKKVTDQEIYDAIRAEFFGKYIIFTYVLNQNVPKTLFTKLGLDIVHETTPCANRLHTERNVDASVLYLVKVS